MSRFTDRAFGTGRDTSVSGAAPLPVHAFPSRFSPAPATPSASSDTSVPAGDALPALDALLAGADDALTAVLAALATAAAHGVEHVHVEPADGRWRLRHRHDDGLEETLLAADDALPAALSRLARSARAFTARLGGERRLVALRTLPGTRGETWLLTLHDGALAPPSLDALGMAPGDLAALRERLARGSGWLPIGTSGALDGARVVRAIAQELAAPDRALICAESGPHPALARVVQLDAAALDEAGATLDADAVLLAADPSRAALDALTTRAAGDLLVVRAVRARRPADVLRELLALGVSPAWIAHAVPLLVTRHRVRTLCPVCRLRAPDGVGPVGVSGDVSSAGWCVRRGAGGARRRAPHAARARRRLVARGQLRDPLRAGRGLRRLRRASPRGRARPDRTGRARPATRDALRDGKIDRALARVERTPALAARLAELVARGEVAAPEAERHVGPSY